jgi:hypothetical protein
VKLEAQAMTLMKDMVTPDGRLKGSRINCHAVYDYLKHFRPHTEIVLALQISHEEVLALIHYIVEHEEEVEANWQAFEAAAAKGNPPEVEAKLVETRARMQAWRQERLQARAEEKVHERSAG